MRPNDIRVAPHFMLREFECRCCRCEKHNFVHLGIFDTPTTLPNSA